MLVLVARDFQGRTESAFESLIVNNVPVTVAKITVCEDQSGRRLLDVKGERPTGRQTRLAVRALARTPENIRLVMAGDGPERRAVERLAQRLDVAHRLELRGWVPRDEVLELMGKAAGVIFTGLREEGGLALAEAMLSGAPVIVLAHGGARTIAERAVDAGRVALIEPAGLSAAAQEMARAMTRFVDDPPGGSGPLLDQEAARRELEAAFRSALEGSPPD